MICFNGATSFQTWKYRKRRTTCGGTKRFNGATSFQTWKFQCVFQLAPLPKQLQWGHVFSDVEIAWIFDRVHYNYRASMGPRLFRRGNGGRKWRDCDDCGASMGPRLFRRGNFLAHAGRAAAVLASMGPRLFRRGNFFIRNFFDNVHKLQWGHVFSDVEMTDGAMLTSGVAYGFNGATSFQTWKCQN